MKAISQESDFRISKFIKDNKGDAIQRDSMEEEPIQLPLPVEATFNFGQEPQSSSPELSVDQPQRQYHQHPDEHIRTIRLLETSQFEIEYRVDLEQEYKVKIIEYDDFKAKYPLILIRFLESRFLNRRNQEGIDFMVPSIDLTLNISIIREALLKKNYVDLMVYPMIENISISDN